MRSKKKTIGRVLAISLLFLAVIAIPSRPVLAQSITLSKTYGYIGTQVTITGQDFTDYKDNDVFIYFGDILVKTVRVSETGTFTVSFNIPSYVAPGQTYTIAVKSEWDSIIASKTFSVVEAILEVEPVTGKIDDWVKITGRRLDPSREICIYFSSDKAIPGQKIDTTVTAYESSYEALYGRLFTDSEGKITPRFNYKIPPELTHGSDKEDVHDGTYYFYITYHSYKGSELTIEALAEFTILGGIIELSPASGQVGSEITITGEGLRSEQNLVITYDGKAISITGGSARTDTEGNFNCTITVPEGVIGQHKIVVKDESGNTPGAEFQLEPKLTVNPDVESAGELVTINGYGFAPREYITIYLNDREIPTIPTFIQTNSVGSFTGTFKVPAGEYSGSGKLEAKDAKQNIAETTFIVLSNPASDPATGIQLSPAISANSPGYIGMKLTVDGAKFAVDTDVTITLNNGKSVKVADTKTDNSGKFSVEFTIPTLAGGSYTLTASDGSINMTAVLFIESQAPILPIPLLPKITDTVDPEAYFDWEGIDDPSGTYYILQIAVDTEFKNIILEKRNLSGSEYRLGENEKLESTDGGEPYYWRIKAVDGAFNESEWTSGGQFYVGQSGKGNSSWIQYVLYGIGVLVIVFLGFWIRRQIISRKTSD